MMRQIFLDTETTGFDFKSGHRIIEFGAVEMIDRKLTGNNLHFYFKPDIEVEAGALQVHGLSNDFLADKPLFSDKIDDIMAYLGQSELIIHNAGFDVPFLNWELQLLSPNKWGALEQHCHIIDSLIMAREKHPGQKNSLDALCSRYGVNNKHRTLHGALLDAEILADVYLMMTGGQLDLFSLMTPAAEDNNNTDNLTKGHTSTSTNQALNLVDLLALKPQCDAHDDYLKLLDKKSKDQTLWRRL
ncbi:DNA polymerase III subunit epsilon [Cysteiniphilum sp. QT6929]|uniref:DNA polymerase III subunit epsilon n=1 Tax=Cysteiniphilum sp. QT6929 TaxID=2975055 RepID=UPI0024B34354|nr:DNA polymerase III subunit epsilon [Cysteiniphilum sp. QT6929]WHN66696.1 DNA polymerase III subunit epsilon [Cysteiniphilum sp. QT6929]